MAAQDLQALVHEIAVKARRASEQNAELSSVRKPLPIFTTIRRARRGA